MSSDLVKLERELGSMETAIGGTKLFDAHLINRILTTIKRVSRKLHRIEKSAYDEGVNLDAASGEVGWMRNRLNRILEMVTKTLILIKQSGFEKPSINLNTETTSETYTLESFSDNEGILVREFRCDIEEWKEHHFFESSARGFTIVQSRILFN